MFQLALDRLVKRVDRALFFGKVLRASGVATPMPSAAMARCAPMRSTGIARWRAHLRPSGTTAGEWTKKNMRLSELVKSFNRGNDPPRAYTSRT
jgi:hypothetical protein